MTQKETLDVIFKFSALLVFAFLFNKSIENRPLAQFEGAFPLQGEKMIVMEGLGKVDFDEIIDLEDQEQMDVRIEKEIIDGEEKMKVTVNGKELSADEYKSFRLKNKSSWTPQKGKKMMMKKRMMKKDTYMCEDCKEKKTMCEDCKDKE
ncbi:MAG: hypothetical protein VW523_02340 [Candidatus Neomarinimicrobiota bacterium]|mgnify:CR=1 FL=1|jgi:hypothetical protein|tara:strand:- start:59 stop:505 length:447 start_codon:yes stop_codon:yes gene_type:complete